MCSTTPRFSYDGSKLGVRAVSTRVSDVYRRWCTRGVPGWGMVPGWVGEGYTGYPPTARGGPARQRSGPRKLLPGGWSGWSSRTGRAWSQVPPSGPGRGPVPSLYLGPCFSPLWANRARFNLIYCKVSQNAGVSPKSVHKACRSPYFQNGPRKSPL